MRLLGRSAGLRPRLLAAVLVAVIVGMGVLTVAFNVVLHARLNSDVNDLLRARAAAQLGTLSTVNGHLRTGEAPDDASVDSRAWIFAGRRALERPQRVAGSVDRAAGRLAAGDRRTLDVKTPPTRLLAVPARHGGRRLGTVVVAVSRAPYERTEREALKASLVLAAILAVAVAAVSRLVLNAALRPVARMTSAAAEWSARDLDQRFALGPPTDELTQLAATLDGLLDRLAAGLRREKRFSAELSHELRTPLAKISAQAQLLAGSEDLPPSVREQALGIVAAATQMQEVVEALVAAARAEGDGRQGTADVTAAARAALDAARPLAVERHIALELADDRTVVRATAESKLVERMLAPLIENSCRLARTRVRVRVRRDGSWVEVVAEDDGPGIEPGEALTIFEPGARGHAGRGAHDGAGLGLSLARRLARSAGGEVEADAAADGGRFVVRLPAA
jgi:signal transduction histidine kinase